MKPVNHSVIQLVSSSVILLLLLISFSSSAQDKVWNLEDCIFYAIENNPKRIQQEAQNQIYKINKREAIGSFIPTLSAGTGIEFNFGRGINPETNTYISSNSFSNSYDIGSSLTLFDGLASIYKFKLAKINQLKGKDDLNFVKDMLALEVMELYFNVLYYKGTSELASLQLDESTASLRQVVRMEELGMKSMPDVAEIRAKESEDQLTLTRQQNLLELEIIKLKEKLNFPIEEILTIGDYNSNTEIQAVTENAFDIYLNAMDFLPKAIVAEKSFEAYKTEYKIAKGSFSPRIFMGAGFFTGFSRLMDGSPYTSFEEQFRNRQGKYIRFSLSIPILSNLSRISYVQRSKQNLIIAESQKYQVLRQVYAEIEQAVADVNGLADECELAQKRTESMDAAHKVNQRKYEEGLISAIELTTSSNRLLNAKVEELRARLSYHLKSRLLQYYKGGAISFSH